MHFVTWILHQTSHNGNIGSAARAIKTMGFDQLVLVNPKDLGAAKSPEAIALASGAEDVLTQLRVTDHLANACQDLPVVFGLTSRDREFGPPAISLQEACEIATQAQLSQTPVGFLFGTERTGLENEDLQYCSHRVWIDANPNYPSLNLSQAVMICAYEMRQAQMRHQQHSDATIPQSIQAVKKANIGAINAAMEHLKEGLEAIEFLDPAHPKKLMERLRHLFDRSQLQEEEVDLLRGIAKQMILHGQKG